MSTDLSSRDKAASMFGRALPLIETTLRREFRLPREHARAVEEEISMWFSRFTLRPGSGRAETLRVELFSATCQAGRKYWKWRLGGALVADARIRRALAREPGEMAKELAAKLWEREEREKRKQSEKLGEAEKEDRS